MGIDGFPGRVTYHSGEAAGARWVVGDGKGWWLGSIGDEGDSVAAQDGAEWGYGDGWLRAR